MVNFKENKTGFPHFRNQENVVSAVTVYVVTVLRTISQNPMLFASITLQYRQQRYLTSFFFVGFGISRVIYP